MITKSEIIISTNSIINEPASERFSYLYESPYRIANRIGKNIQRDDLKSFYNRELFTDLLERKAINPISQIKEVQGNFHILAGFVLESFIERRINSNNMIKGNILKWILRDCPTEFEKIEDINEIFAVVIGSGHAKKKYPDIFSPANPNIDIIFLNTKEKWYPPIHNIHKRLAGVQIKSITTDYTRNIIHKIIGRKIYKKKFENGDQYYPIYDNVLTLLNETDGIHSYEKCMNILYKEYKNLFSKEEFNAIEKRVIKPEHVGFDQKEIDFYYHLIKDWFINPSSYKFNNMDSHLIDSFSILNLDYMNSQKGSHLNKHLILSL